MFSDTTLWVIWRKCIYVQMLACNTLNTLLLRFGVMGFELMRDGDVNGLWGLMEHGIK